MLFFQKIKNMITIKMQLKRNENANKINKENIKNK